MFDKQKAKLEAIPAVAKKRILYGLRYSGLSLQWGGARFLEIILGYTRRKMERLLLEAHGSSIAMANRIWDEREQLGQEDQEVTGDQPAEVVYVSNKNASEPVEAEDILIVDKG